MCGRKLRAAHPVAQRNAGRQHGGEHDGRPRNARGNTDADEDTGADHRAESHHHGAERAELPVEPRCGHDLLLAGLGRGHNRAVTESSYRPH